MKYKIKNKNKILFFSKPGFFERINFIFISKFLMPLAFFLAAGFFIVLVQWIALVRESNSFSVGEAAPETYRVIFQMRYEDHEATKALKSIVKDSIAGVAVRDVSAKTRLQKRLEAIRDMKENTPKNSGYLAIFPEPLLNALLKLRDEDKARILNSAMTVGEAYVDRLQKEKVYRSNSNLLSSILWEEINKANPSGADSNFIYQILAGLGNMSLRVDDELTKLARDALVDDVPAVDRKLEPGDIIVNKGEIVTEQTAVLLRVQGYTEDEFPFAQLCFVTLFVVAVPLWLNILYNGAGDQKPTWWCVIFIIVSAWTCEAFASTFRIYGAGTLASVMLSYLCAPSYIAFCIASLSSISGVYIISGQALSNLMQLSLLAVLASTIGFYLLRNLESRRQLSRRIFIMAMILTVVKMFMRWLQGPPLVQDNFRLFIPLGEFWQEAGLFFLFEVASTHFAALVLQYFEEYLGVLSILSLREVSHPSSPLLRELQRTAPGTYQHCLTIATLIEAVGIELKMDVNLLRAGAYYHDIGKLRKPQYFVENQGGGLNIHDGMTPMLSSMTIISHVRDGLDLAYEAKLPKRIRDFIAEHHGTTSTRYFYNKAVAEGENVEWSAFCYPGPRPQTRETALLMIVDSVEAAVRAANIRELEGQTLEVIEKIVTQVINSKINENQFDDINFTLKDLTRIKETLVSVLTSMYHTRKVKKIVKKTK